MHITLTSSDLWTGAIFMVAAPVVAFLIGSCVRLTWLTKRPAHHWFLGAIAVALLPSLSHWVLNEVSSTGIGFFASRIDSSRYSLVLFFGAVAALNRAASASVGLQSQGLFKWEFLAFTVMWVTSILITGGTIFLVLVGLVSAAVMTRKTPWFSASVSITLLLGVGFLGYLLCKPYLFTRLINGIFAWDEPLGRGFVAAQVRKTLSDAGWAGSDTLYFIPAAPTKFGLAVIGSAWGWIAMACVTLALMTLLWLLYKSLSVLNDDWVRHFGLAMLGFVWMSSAINIAANMGWIAPSAGIAFLSRDFFLTVCASLLLGLSLRPSFKGASHAHA